MDKTFLKRYSRKTKKELIKEIENLKLTIDEIMILLKSHDLLKYKRLLNLIMRGETSGSSLNSFEDVKRINSEPAWSG